MQKEVFRKADYGSGDLTMSYRRTIAEKFAKNIKSDKIEEIILFGSVAREEDTPESDIDILIISDYQKDIQEQINYESFQVVLHDQEYISPIIMSTSKLNEINDFTFMRNVRREGIVLG